jgi:hypothetical protein
VWHAPYATVPRLPKLNLKLGSRPAPSPLALWTSRFYKNLIETSFCPVQTALLVMRGVVAGLSVTGQTQPLRHGPATSSTGCKGTYGWT